MNDVDESALYEIGQYVEGCRRGEDGRIPTGLIVANADGQLQSQLVDHWVPLEGVQVCPLVVPLEASQAPNLTTALKNFIRSAITLQGGVDEYPAFLAKQKKLVPMSFDLDLLEIFAKEKNLDKIVLSIPNVETFDIGILSELISILNAWDGDVQFALILGLATTVELFETRLSKATIRLLDATVFDLSSLRDRHYEIYKSAQSNPEAKVFLGHATSNLLAELGTDQGTTTKTFGKAVKYAYMSHFFANALSILATDAVPDANDSALCEAIRNTNSFQRHAEMLLKEGIKGAQEAHRLLSDDAYLLTTARAAVSHGQQRMHNKDKALSAFAELPGLLDLVPPANASAFDLDLEALSGRDFTKSGPYTSITSMIEKRRSTELLALLSKSSLTTRHPPNPHPETESSTPSSSAIHEIHARLLALQSLNPDTALKSAHDPSHPRTATTLNPHSNTIALTTVTTIPLTPAEEQYTALVDDLLSVLDAYFDTHINTSHYKTLLLHEAFVFDLKIPLAGAFAPRPRFAVERALGRPADYLGCACCPGGGGGQAGGRAGGEDGEEQEKMMMMMMPPTSVLWSLWREAGALVNVRDLWDAFRARVVVGEQQQQQPPQRLGDGDEGDDRDDGVTAGEEEKGGSSSSPGAGDDRAPGIREGGAAAAMVSERAARALFCRSLAELKMLGYVKATKRRPGPGVDCLLKSGWAGL